jgi:hypothetical protein
LTLKENTLIFFPKTSLKKTSFQTNKRDRSGTGRFPEFRKGAGYGGKMDQDNLSGGPLSGTPDT